MKKLITLILMFVAFKVSAQTYTLNYDSVRVGKTASSSVLIPKDFYLKGLPKGLLSIRADGKVIHNDTTYATNTGSIQNQDTIEQAANFRISGTGEAINYYAIDYINPSSSRMYNGGFVTSDGSAANGALYHGRVQLQNYGGSAEFNIPDAAKATVTSDTDLELSGVHVKSTAIPTESTDIIRKNELDGLRDSTYNINKNGYDILSKSTFRNNLGVYAKTDTGTTIQTVSNFFPKGDTRYYTKAQIANLLSQTETFKLDTVAPTSGSTYTSPTLANRVVLGVWRSGLWYTAITSGTPNDNQVLFDASAGSATFNTAFYTDANEYLGFQYKASSGMPPNASVVEVPTYAAMIAKGAPIVMTIYKVAIDERESYTDSIYYWFPDGTLIWAATVESIP